MEYYYYCPKGNEKYSVSSTEDKPNTPTKSGLSAGAIVGIVIACVVVVAALAVAIVCYLSNKAKNEAGVYNYSGAYTSI